MSHASIIALAPDHTSDATFRAWGSAVAVKLAAMGLVQTADTGQINWATVLKPGAANTAMGYEIWRFADALQATKPIMLKIEYGSGSATANPGMWITVGTATNGAGVHTGPTSSRLQSGAGAAQVAAENCLFSGDTNRMAVHLFFNGAASRHIMIGVERSKDAAGADTGEGVYITVGSIGSGAGTQRQEYYQWGIGTAGTESDLGIMVPRVGSGASGPDFAVFPQFHAQGILLPHGLLYLGYFTATVIANSTIAITVYGAVRTYYALALVTNPNRAAIGGTSLLVLYQ